MTTTEISNVTSSMPGVPDAAQQTALEWLYPTCTAQGCGSVARLQISPAVSQLRSM